MQHSREHSDLLEQLDCAPQATAPWLVEWACEIEYDSGVYCLLEIILCGDVKVGWFLTSATPFTLLGFETVVLRITFLNAYCIRIPVNREYLLCALYGNMVFLIGCIDKMHDHTSLCVGTCSEQWMSLNIQVSNQLTALMEFWLFVVLHAPILWRHSIGGNSGYHLGRSVSSAVSW